MSKKNDVSRRQFLSRTALTLPVAAAAIPTAMELAAPMKANAAAYPSIRQSIPNRTLPNRTSIPSGYVVVSGLDTTETYDCSQAIQDAIDSAVSQGKGTVIIPRLSTTSDTHPQGNRCIYRINPQRILVDNSNSSDPVYCAIQLKDQIRLECEPGVTLQATPINSDPNKLTKRAHLLYAKGISSVEIINGSYVGERQKHIYSGSDFYNNPDNTDEWCHGLNISGVQHMTVRGTHFSNCTGDGICIGGSTTFDIVFCDVLSTGNRRQGLSITQGDSISVYDSEFSYTYGTLPMNGIDIEPDAPSSSVTNVTIDNCILKGNEGNGIECNVHTDNVTIQNVDILNCLFSYNYYIGFSTHRSAGTVTGGTVFGCAFYQNGNVGLSIGQGVTGYTVGATDTSGAGNYTNSFADNTIISHPVSSIRTTYPNAADTPHTGYVSGRDMNTGTVSDNTWRTNLFTS